MAVETSREDRRAAGEEVDADAGWSMEEIATGIKACLLAVTRSLHRLQSAELEMGKALWPDAVEPSSMSRLSRWLEADSSRLDSSRALAARAGAYPALRLAKSWYRNLDLGKLAAERDDSDEELVALED
ncbi:hypothetical protein D1007_05030 [Hordeum vulgare]|nr:hypothetical protein D1007_05030 [Hordeum vulgare]